MSGPGETSPMMGPAGGSHQARQALRRSMDEQFEHDKHEAKRRWGHTAAYRESAARVPGYGPAEWRSIRAEKEEIAAGFAELLHAGESASGERARALAERHRQHISRWFYPCSPEMHRRLGDTYVSDQRFARNYERLAEGLSVYVREAIAANSDEQRASTSVT